jgi:hypothetical protein
MVQAARAGRDAGALSRRLRYRDRRARRLLADYTRRGGKALHEIENRIEAFIRAALGSLPAASLTAREIRDWHEGLAEVARKMRAAVPVFRPAQVARAASGEFMRGAAGSHWNRASPGRAGPRPD